MKHAWAATGKRAVLYFTLVFIPVVVLGPSSLVNSMNNRDFVSKREMQGQVPEDALCLPNTHYGVHTCTHHPYSWLQVCVFTDSVTGTWTGIALPL